MTRYVGGSSYDLDYDAENRLVEISGAVAENYVYDGDGNRVKATIGTTTTYVGNYFEWTGSTSSVNVRSRYYYAGSIKVAMRTGSSTLNYLLGDHSLVPRDRLGCTSITTESNRAFGSEIRY